MKQAVLFLLPCLLLHTGCQQRSEKEAPETVARRIEQVETRLMPAVVIEGEPSPVFTLEERMRHHKVPAVSIALINDGKIEWAKAYGYLNADSLTKADTATLFQAASISKPVAALAALQLVEEGKLRMDDDVNLALKNWKIKSTPFTLTNTVSLRELLTHTAGLTVHGFRGYARGESVPTVINVLNGEKPANSAVVIPDTTSGSYWRYSGGGYTVMQQLVADVTGSDFPSLMQQRVLLPMGMQHSTYQQPLPVSRHAQASTGHRSTGEKVAGDWHTYPEMAAAGLWTTPSDLARYAIEVQQSLKGASNKVLTQEMTQQMLTKHTNNWGLGPGLQGNGDTLTFSHGGANEGFRCYLYAFAHTGKGVVIMTNSDNGSAVVDELMRSISEVYHWGTHSPVRKTIAPLKPEQLTAFAGNYRIADQGLELAITPQPDHLLVDLRWSGEQMRLYPESDSTFFTKEEATIFQFDKGTDDRINRVSVYEGQYTFIRAD
jgi:CubicO group peptidase (beta-lactamase class C family)